MEPEILAFAERIGAREPTDSDENLALFRKFFREHNYFLHQTGFLIIKLSRSKRPFYGLTKEIMDLLGEHSSYNLVLLKPSGQGWAFNKLEVLENLSSRAWNLDGKGQQYKINLPLPESNYFFGHKGCLQKLAGSPAA